MKAQQVVIVDDAPLNLRILSAIVGELDSVVVEAFGSSVEALRWCETHDADCFILDYRMPAPDGLEMVGILRANPRFELVPILIITAERERAVRIEALGAGANDFLERPVERREVLARLRTSLALQAARRELALYVGSLEASLHDEERRAREQAARLVSLWHIANDARMDHTEAVYAMLANGAESLRPGRRFYGYLMRRDGDELVVEATNRRVRSPDEPQKKQAGERFRLADCAERYAFETGRTHMWNDIRTDATAVALPGVRSSSRRAVITTPFSVGRTDYCLTFASRVENADPFGAEDLTYVELLASHYAMRIQHAWQSDRIQYQISHDALTGLRNRTQFRLDAASRAESNVPYAVAMISLDGFRGVNDTYGHVVGDRLLTEVGAALERLATATDIVARSAGDTFGIFLDGVASSADLEARIDAFADRFEQPFSTGDRDGVEFVPLRATIGVAVSGDGASFEDVMSRADAALFVSKRERRARVLVYEPGMESELQSTTRLLTEISSALKNGEFELVLQPHIDLTSMAAVGAEALIRWHHPERGLIMPDQFIGVAERTGMIRAITTWVMVEALRLSAALQVRQPGFRLYFNVSAYDLRDMSLVDVLTAAAENGSRLETVGIEITETGAMQDVGMAVRFVRELQQLGMLVAIDDFGTGHSSLSMLRRLPVNVLKIDRSFVREILECEEDALLAESVIEVGRRLGFATLAEGVESEEQLAWLAQKGCRYAQGYAITPPMPFDRFCTWLETSREDGAYAIASDVRHIEMSEPRRA